MLDASVIKPEFYRRGLQTKSVPNLHIGISYILMPPPLFSCEAEETVNSMIVALTVSLLFFLFSPYIY
jgi:hypothetical protein